MKACSVASQRGYGHDGDVRWRRRASASMAEVVRGRGRARGEGETVAELTAVAGERTASSGKGWSERGGEGDLRWPELRTSSVQRLRGERALGARPTRCKRRRRSSWTRWRSTRMTEGAATTTVRRQGRRPWWGTAKGERQGGMACPGLRGATWRRLGVQGSGGKQVTPWRARARRRHLPACLAGKKQLAGAGQHSAGPPGGPAGELAGLRLVNFSLFLCFSYLFYYFCNFRALLKMPGHFHKS